MDVIVVTRCKKADWWKGSVVASNVEIKTLQVREV